MDMEVVTFTYPRFEELIADLRASGQLNSLADRRRGLTGRRVWDRALEFMLREGSSRYSIDESDAPPPATASDALRVWPDRAPLLLVEPELPVQ